MLQENISQFGGDPGCVTLLGQGTGATLTSLLLLSPITQVSRYSVSGGECSGKVIAAFTNLKLK